mmetsp:Transcript_6768/g.9851  ORF Transcript_6768/g.9851 Transcript_6768/m.9851 type:complete len:1041 (-) Transcript_6768:35-3157(-)
MNKIIVVLLLIAIILIANTITAHEQHDGGHKESSDETEKHVHGHHCAHDDIFIKDRPTREQKYEGHPFDKKNKRSIQSAIYNPIRIHIDYSELDSDLSSQQTLLSLIKDTVTPWVTAKLASFLKVVPVSGNLKLGRYCYSRWGNGNCYGYNSPTTCGFKTVPQAHLATEQQCESPNSCTTVQGGAGIANADIVLYFGAKNYGACAQSGTSTLAFASSCSRDQYDRPIAGFVNFCTNVISSEDVEVAKYTVLHEIVHAMGFSKNEFAFYRDANGQPRTARSGINNEPPNNGYNYVADTNTIITVEERGHTLQKLVLPTVLEKARTHFNCPTLNGVELENGGGSGTAGSHWEQRITRGEFMNGQIPNHPVVSIFTLAALADSGWYRVDFTKADVLPWGYNRGCDFTNKNCIANSNTAFKDHFCTVNGDLQCTQNHYAKGQCSVADYSGALPGHYQYFSTANRGGINELLDYCPVYSLYLTGGGRTSDCRFTSNTISTTRDEIWGSTSRCIVNTLSKSSQSNTVRGGCYQVDCTNTPVSITITVNGQNVVCSATQGAGYQQTIPGYAGHIRCPDIKSICPPPPTDPCENINCGSHGTCNNGACICDSGWFNSPHDVCDVTTCYGHYSNSSSVCSTKGSCVGPDTCSCQTGYVGDICDIHTCAGIRFNETTVCSGRGNCTDANTCECEEGYEGSNCEKFYCYGFEHGATDACSGNGQCIKPNNCSCDSNFNGDKCQCAGAQGSCVCANNVTSIPPLQVNETYCPCTGGYTNPPLCNVPICYGKSGNDSCNGSNHGTCRSPNNCTCTIAYKGNECQTASQCEEFDFCNQQGTCNGGLCDCLTGFSGASCDQPICYGHASGDSSVCSGHGTCESPNNCNCSTGYTGSQCDTPVCYGKPSNDPEVCTGRGTCTSPDNCVCSNSTEFGGDQCDKPFCFGKRSDDDQVCSGHGECIYVDSCKCSTITETKTTGGTEDYAGFNKKYQGSQCSQYECLNMCAEVCNKNTGKCPPTTKSTSTVREGEEVFSSASLPITSALILMLTFVLLLV